MPGTGWTWRPRPCRAGWARRPPPSRLVDLVRRDVLTGSNILYDDDTPVPVLAPGLGRTKTGRLWVYVRDERPYGGLRLPAVVFLASPDRMGERPLAHLAGF